MRLFLFLLLYIFIVSILTHNYILHLTYFFDHHIIVFSETPITTISFSRFWSVESYMLKYKYFCKISHDSFTTNNSYFYLFIHWFSFFDHKSLFVLFFGLFIEYHYSTIIIWIDNHSYFQYIFTWWYSHKWKWEICKSCF